MSKEAYDDAGGWQSFQSPFPQEAEADNDTDVEKAAAKSVTIADALKTIRNDRALTRAALRIPFPVVYLALFVYMVYVHIPSEGLYHQGNALFTSLATKGEGTITKDSPMQFYNIQTPSDVFDWLELTLAPAIFVTESYNGIELAESDVGRVATFNRILGATRFTETYSLAVECDNQDYLHAIYSTCHDRDTTGNFSSYFSFDLNASDAVAYFEQYKTNSSWLDPTNTVSLVVDIVTYNAEVSAYAVTTLKLEYQEGGLIKPSATTISAKSTAYRSSEPYVADILVLLCLLLVLYRQIRELWRKETRFTDALRNFWRFVDYVSTAFVIVFFALWGIVVGITIQDSFRERIEKLSGGELAWASDDEAIADLEAIISSLKRIASFTVALRLIATGTILCLGVCILERFRFHPRLDVLSQTVARSLSKFGAFFIVCLVIIVTFALSGHAIFGDRVEEFSTIADSLMACVNILFGNFDYGVINGMYGPVAILYYWIYMIVVTLVLLNMMLAIVLDTYEDVSKQAFTDTTVTSIRRVGYSVFYQVVLWVCDFRCSRRASNGVGSYTSRRQIVFLGRIRPDALEATLAALADEDIKGEESKYDHLTPQSLRSMFSNAVVTDKEARATVDYLVSGHSDLKNKEEEEKADKSEMITKEELLTGLRGLQELRESFTVVEMQPLASRMTAIERRLENIGNLEQKLDLVLASLAQRS